MRHLLKDAAMIEGCDCDRKNASLEKGGDPNPGCVFSKTHGRWVRVDECGRVDELAALWTEGAVWNRKAVLRKAANSHVDWPGAWRADGIVTHVCLPLFLNGIFGPIFRPELLVG